MYKTLYDDNRSGRWVAEKYNISPLSTLGIKSWGKKEQKKNTKKEEEENR